jgi:hypothetical protein
MTKLTTAIFGGVLLSFLVFGGLMWIGGTLGQRGVSIFEFYLFQILTGAAVGGFVRSLQKRKAWLMAIVCLVPAMLLEYVTAFAYLRSFSKQGLSFLLIGSVLEISAALAASYAFSRKIEKSEALTD